MTTHTYTIPAATRDRIEAETQEQPTPRAFCYARLIGGPEDGRHWLIDREQIDAPEVKGLVTYHRSGTTQWANLYRLERDGDGWAYVFQRATAI